MLASFSVIPIGIGEELKEVIADVIAIVEKSGLDYKLGAMQTTLEGDSRQVMDVIMQCHDQLMKTSNRVLTSITIDDRKGAAGRLEGKVKDVENQLGRTLNHE
jgi:uncharacterized protein (TIGR00106 family)